MILLIACFLFRRSAHESQLLFGSSDSTISGFCLQCLALVIRVNDVGFEARIEIGSFCCPNIVFLGVGAAGVLGVHPGVEHQAKELADTIVHIR